MFHTPIKTPWHNDPRVSVLLAQLADKPAVAVEHSTSYVRSRETWIVYTGVVADGLRAIRDEYGARLIDQANRTERDADYAAFSAHNWETPTVECLIDDAMADAIRNRPDVLTTIMVALCSPVRVAA